MNQSNQKIKMKALLRLSVFFLFFLALLYFFRSLSLENTLELLKNNPAQAVIVSIILNILLSLSGILPSVFLTGANTLVFGLALGGLISWIGELLGATLSFLLYRYFLDKPLRVITGERLIFPFLNNIKRETGFKLVLAARLLPMVPSGIVNLISALGPLSLSPFLLATALGKIPSLVLESFIGHDLFLWRDYWPRLLVSLCIAGIIYGAGRLYLRKIGSNHNNRT